MRTKISRLRLILSSCDYDVLVFTETWLRDDIDSTEISPDYTFFRCDRSRVNSQHARGGGVLIAVKHHLRCEMFPLSDCDQLEQVAVRMKLDNRSLYIITIYIPPNSSADRYSAHANAVQGLVNSVSADDIVLSVGDFNLPNLRWQMDDELNGYIPSNASSEQEKSLIETLFATGLRQVNNFENINNRLLDLVFVSLPELLDLVQPPAPLLPIDNHHAPFILLLDVSVSIPATLDDDADRVEYDFNVCDFDQLAIALGNVDWSILEQTGTVDELSAAFYNKLLEICDALVPRKRRTINSPSSKPWWTSELRRLRNLLRKARQHFFLSKSEGDKIALREAEATYKSVLQTTYDDYISGVQASVKQDPTRFWGFVKKLKSSTRIPCNVSYDETLASSNEEAANLFAEFFESVFSKSSPVPRQDCFAHVPSHNINFPIMQFTADEVLNVIYTLDCKKGPGTDGIPPLLLRKCAAELVTPVTLLFNRSLSERTFPSVWKTAFIVPIHKSGNINRVRNYRGISILCCLSKIFEKLMHNALYTVAAPIISEYQHGFMRHRSTTTNLMCYVTSLSREIESGNQVDAVYVDFAKAFDTVPHILIIDKLKRIGYPDWLTEWIFSYLSARTAQVVVNSSRSRQINVTSGVPQGSVLGPLLFNIFVNDLCLCLSSFKLSFADDLKFYRIIRSSLDCFALQEDINTLLIWCSDNGMRVNNDKCKVITFTRSNNPVTHQYHMEFAHLERVASICDLGVTIDAKLQFHEHVGITTAKAFSVLGLIRRHASEFTDIYALKTLYCSLVRSILEYAAPVWSPYYVAPILSIERVQKKFVRFVLRSLPWNDPDNLPPYPDRCQLISLEPLTVRRVKMQRLFVFDILNGAIDCPALLEQISLQIPSRRLRNTPMIAIPYHRTNYGFNNPFDSCLRSFNVVSDQFDFDMCKNVFKTRISRIV